MSPQLAHAAPPAKFVSYVRVSTQRQGQSGLGQDAQTDAVTRFVAASGGVVIASFTETESGKKASNRPQLQAALELCRRERATLLIAKLDRLARNVHFISGLLESGVGFFAVDAPSKDRFMLHVQAAFAEEEARRISLRTKEALAAAKRRGVQLGLTGKALALRHAAAAQERARSYAALFAELEKQGAKTTKDFRDILNSRGIPGPGGGRWHIPITHRTLKRLGMGRRIRAPRCKCDSHSNLGGVAEVVEV